MTSIRELHRVMDRLEAIHFDTRGETGDRVGLAMHRMGLGIPNDDDLNVLLQDAAMLDTAISHTVGAPRRRSEQLNEAPALRLAADVLLARSPQDTRVALTALRDLACNGRVRTDGGTVRALPDQVGFARLLLRHVARRLSTTASQPAGEAGSTGR